MVNKWKRFPVVVFMVVTICLIVKTPIVEAKRYVMTYLYGMGDYIEMIEERDNFFDEVSPSYFDLDENGELKLNYIDENFVNDMKKKNIKIVPFLSNHWDRNVGRKTVQNYEILSSQISEAVLKNNLDGVNVDIENLTEIDKNDYLNLVKRLREKMSDEKILVVSVAANPNEINVGWQGSYDYNELSKFCDYIMIMAYDEHYEGGEVGPVASIEFVEKSIQYALKYVPNEKIILGIPLYGRFWSTNTGEGGIGVSLKQVNQIIEKYDSIVTFDDVSKSPKALVNIDAEELPKIGGKTLAAGQYEFWYENEKSIDAKLELIEKYELKGVGMWKIGLETYDVWETIKENLKNVVNNLKYVFNDVDFNYWAYNHIEFVNERGIMIGKEYGKFKPEDSLTRAELAIMIVRIIEKENINITYQSTQKNDFTDIKTHWAKDYITKLQAFDIIKGYENMEFRPDNLVTRAEACVIINRLLEKIEEPEKNKEILVYQDVKVDYWAYLEISLLSEKGVINGYSNGMFYPENPIKRSEIAKIIQKMIEISV